MRTSHEPGRAGRPLHAAKGLSPSIARGATECALHLRLLLLAWVLLGLFARADVPRLDTLFPAGGQVGTEFRVVATGNLDPWPAAVWTDDTNIVFRPGGTNRHYQVSIGAATPPGAHLVRAFNAEGASAPFLFVVGIYAEHLESRLAGQAPEENGKGIGSEDATSDSVRAETADADANEANGKPPTPVTQFPVTINGEIAQPGERDSYFLDLVGDQTLTAELTAIGIDSSLVGMLVLADARGSVLGLQTSIQQRDPTLVARIPRPGRYRLEVTSGGQSAVALPAVYRLTLTVQVATATEILASRAEEPEIQQAPTLRPAMRNTRLFFPGVLHGHIDPPGDIDRFAFDAEEGVAYVFTGWASGQAEDFEFELKVTDGDEEVLQASGGSAAPHLVWSAPWDGYYFLTVEGVEDGGGHCQYTIELAEPRWRFEATVDEHAVRIRPGGTARLPIQLIRPRRYDGFLAITPSFLPDGVFTAALVTGPDQLEADLVLTAAPDAPPAGGPLSVLVEPINSPTTPFETARYTLRGRYAPPDGLLTNETDQLWLTVTPPPSKD